MSLPLYIPIIAAAVGLGVSGSITWRALRTGVVPTRLGDFARATQPAAYWTAVGSSLVIMAAFAVLAALFLGGRLGG